MSSKPVIRTIDGREELLAIVDELRADIEKGDVFALAYVSHQKDGTVQAIGIANRGAINMLLAAAARLLFACDRYGGRAEEAYADGHGDDDG